MRIDKCKCGEYLKTKRGDMAVFLGICPKGYDKRFHYNIAIFPGNLNYYISTCDCYGVVDGSLHDEIIGYWED